MFSSFFSVLKEDVLSHTDVDQGRDAGARSIEFLDRL